MKEVGPFDSYIFPQIGKNSTIISIPAEEFLMTDKAIQAGAITVQHIFGDRKEMNKVAFIDALAELLNSSYSHASSVLNDLVITGLVSKSGSLIKIGNHNFEENITFVDYDSAGDKWEDTPF